MNILIVDDSKIARISMEKIVRNYFQQKGWYSPTIFRADDGERATRILQKHKINMVLLDYNMPNMNGEELVEYIRAYKDWNSVRIVMVTTEGSKESVMRLIKKGVNSYIVKPFNQEKVFQKLDILTARMIVCSG